MKTDEPWKFGDENWKKAIQSVHLINSQLNLKAKTH
jgi:hypothetical protein